MFIPLIAPLAGVIATTAVGVAIEGAAKIVIPPAASAITAFGIKAGTSIVGFVAGVAVSRIVKRNIDSVADVANVGISHAVPAMLAVDMRERNTRSLVEVSHGHRGVLVDVSNEAVTNLFGLGTSREDDLLEVVRRTGACGDFSLLRSGGRATMTAVVHARI